MSPGDGIVEKIYEVCMKSIAHMTPLRDATLLCQAARLSISCVTPCFNESANLLQFLPKLKATLMQMSDDWEIIVVDDGSTDNTAEILEHWKLQYGIRVVQLSRNFGKEAALSAGLELTSSDAVITMDADLQHPTELIPSFVAHWQAGADVVYAQRDNRRDELWWKRVGTQFFYWLVNTKNRFEVPDGAGDFRLMDRKVVDALLALPERNRFMKGLYSWVGFKSIAVPYTPDKRIHGESKFSGLNLLRLSLDGLTSFTTWPLRAVSALGFLVALLALVYGSALIAVAVKLVVA
jgi:polyisoprenyl-phosphate glycosyltransferase